jgi:hypothetical protein
LIYPTNRARKYTSRSTDGRGIIRERWDFFSLHTLQTTSEELLNFRVEVDTIPADDSPNSLVANPNFLRKAFDVIFVGGFDDAQVGLAKLIAKIAAASLAEYHRRGGKVVLLHDVSFRAGPNPDAWHYFEGQFGSLKPALNTRAVPKLPMRPLIRYWHPHFPSRIQSTSDKGRLDRRISIKQL